MKAVERDNMQSKINSLEAQLKASLELNTVYEATIAQRDETIVRLNTAIAGHEIHILRLKNLAINRGDKLRALENKTGEATTKKNIWGADMDELKKEYMTRTAAGEAVVISGGKVVLKADLYKNAA